MRFKPNVTVAAVIEQDGKFLLIEERIDGVLMLNQPAGHLERGETLAEAAAREALEESAYPFTPQFLVGIYYWPDEAKDITYLRFAFGGSAAAVQAGRQLDAGIERAVWMTREEVAGSRARHRSPYVLTCVDDYLAGRRYPLEMLRNFGAGTA